MSLTGCLAGWLTGWLAGWLTVCLTDLLAIWLSVWPVVWLTGYLAGCLPNCLGVWVFVWVFVCVLVARFRKYRDRKECISNSRESKLIDFYRGYRKVIRKERELIDSCRLELSDVILFLALTSVRRSSS